MMTKWADYCISEVRYDNARKHIVRVKVHVDSGETIGAATEWPRKDVVSLIDDGKSFITITKGTDGWSKGKIVHVIKVNGVKYIRTDGNSREADNLEKLPEF